MSIASQVTALREQRGWSQRELAERSGLSRRTVQRIESGTHTLSDNLEALSRALGAPLIHHPTQEQR